MVASAGHSGLDVAGLLRATTDHVFGRRDNADDFDAGLEYSERPHDTDHGGAADIYVVLHFSMPSAGLMETPPVSKVAALPIGETDYGELPAFSYRLRACR